MDPNRQKILEIWRDFTTKIAELTKRYQGVLRQADEEYKKKEIEKIKQKLRTEL